MDLYEIQIYIQVGDNQESESLEQKVGRLQKKYLICSSEALALGDKLGHAGKFEKEKCIN